MKKLLFLFAVLCAMVISSCQNENNTTLEISEVSLDLPKVASDNTVTIATDADTWSAFTTAEWITTKANGGELTVSVMENTTTKERSAKVVVIAGEMSQTIDIHQAASDVTIVTLPDKLNIDQWGGTFQFDVNANTKDWTISSDADWVTLNPKQFKSEVVVQVAENTDRAERIATLTLTAGSATQQFVINQSGIMFFIFPHLEFGCDALSIKNFETARKSELMGQPDGLFNRDKWTYVTKSAAFSTVRYEVGANGLTKVIMFTATKDFGQTELDNYKAYLTSNGYVDKGNNVFGNEAASAEVTLIMEAADPQVVFTYKPTQPQAYPTFSTFPYGLVNFKSTEADIKTYEAANGGTYNGTNSVIDPTRATNILYFDIQGDPFARAYFVSNTDPKVLSEAAQYYKDWSKAFFQLKGQYYLTKEFVALVAKEGFVFQGMTKAWYVYVNEAKNLTMGVTVAKYTNFEFPVLDIRTFQTDKEAAARLFESKAKASKTETVKSIKDSRLMN